MNAPAEPAKSAENQKTKEFLEKNQKKSGEPAVFGNCPQQRHQDTNWLFGSEAGRPREK